MPERDLFFSERVKEEGSLRKTRSLTSSYV
jgi:hypothetical protein